MSTPTRGYDENLLEEAPAATRAQLQEGYNVDLLDERRPQRSRSTHVPNATPPVSSTTPRPNVPVLGSQEKFQERGSSPSPSSKKRLPFWRTTAGIITIVVVVIVIIGAVVGGAVGGTVGKHHSDAAVSSSSSSSASISSNTVASGVQSMGGGGGGGVTTQGIAPGTDANGVNPTTTPPDATPTAAAAAAPVTHSSPVALTVSAEYASNSNPS